MAEKARQAGQFDPAQVRNYAERKFSLDRMVVQYAELYARVLGESGSKPGVSVHRRAIA
jgi:hypothetical protein